MLRTMEKRMIEQQTTMPIMYCNNCGGKGHIFRTCRDPVLSCGILLLDSPMLPVDPAITKILMVRRKDSMSFAEFMRGKYDLHDEQYISTLVKNMTLKEQAGITCDSFDTLWKQLWGDDRISSDYPISREKFYQLDRAKIMRDNLSEYTEPEWGFPKGRRTRGETDMSCAIREFGEETNIPREAYTVLKNIIFEETFTGLNNIRYRHVYFVALLTDPSLVNLTQRFTPMQRREISAIAWKSIHEVEQLIRPHHTERRTMVEQIKSTIQTFESD